MREPAEWLDIDVGGDPVLVMGWRSQRSPRGLQAVAVAVLDTAFDTLRDIATKTQEALAARQRVPWHPDAHLDDGEEYLGIDVEDLPVPPPQAPAAAAPVGDPQLAEATQFLRLVLHPGTLDEVAPGGLNELPEGNFTFFALVWEDGDDGNPVAFADAYDPIAVFRGASHYFRGAGTLREAAPPTVALPGRTTLGVR